MEPTAGRFMFSLLLLAALNPIVKGDLFNSLHDLEALFHHEDHLLQNLQMNIHSLQSKLNVLIQRYEQMVKGRPRGENAEKYLGNPVNAFSMVRRMAREWPLVLNLMVEKYVLPEHLMKLPSEVDLLSALRGLARLQDVYNLDSGQLAEGRLERGWNQSGMTASDCYDMGRYWYRQMEFGMSSSWLHLALSKIEKGDTTVHHEHVLAHLYLAETFTGCQTSYETTPTGTLLQQLVVNHPNYVLSSELNMDFQQALSRNCSWLEDDSRQQLVDMSRMSDEHNIMYSQMCQGFGQSSEVLRCHYVHYNNPRLLVAPFKLEELHLNPPVVMFHQVISDTEIENMKAAFLRVKTDCETVHDNEPERSYYRTCHVGWIEDDMTPTSPILSRRMADMTNLHLGTSEVNQVASYGLGGEFMLHQDPLENAALSDNNHLGNRVATLMFYLNDVKRGGRTVFPYIETSVVPSKGSAIFWFNLDSRGQEVPSMMHGGCPVLMGSKWVINKWIHEGGQDFETTCPVDGRFPRKYFYKVT